MIRITIPLKMHVGQTCQPIVKKGDAVKRGQLIAIPQSNSLGANIHASYTGNIVEITDKTIIIEADEKQDFSQFSKIPKVETYLEAINEAGIVGAGGAGFPTAVKLKQKLPEGVFVANAVECEALLAHNIQQVEAYADQLVRGIKYCMEIIKTPKAYIAIKAKHQKAIQVLTKATANTSDIELFLMPDMYPAGDERVIVREILGVRLHPGQLPGTVGACIDNVETIKNIVEAIENSKPVIDKDITVSGRVQRQKTVFVNVPIGTSVSVLIDQAGGYIEPHGEIVIGGPMTGRAGDESTPITKTSGGVLVAMPFPEDHRKVGLLVCECGGSEERMKHIAEGMGAEIVGSRMCKRMEKDANGRYRCNLPGICPGWAENVLALKKEGAEIMIAGTCSD